MGQIIGYQTSHAAWIALEEFLSLIKDKNYVAPVRISNNPKRLPIHHEIHTKIEDDY